MSLAKTLSSTLQSPQWRGAAPIAVVLLAWWLSVSSGLVSPLTLAPLPKVLAGFVDPQISRELAQSLAASGLRLVQGGLIGVAAGLALGSAMGLSPTVDRLVGPSFHAFRQVALFAWIPLLTAWAGSGDLAKIAFIALAAFKPTVMGAYEGARNVPQSYLEVGRILCLPRRKTLTRIVIPAALPSIVSGLQLALIYGWLGAIGAEYLMGGVATGIGSFVMAAREHIQMDQVFMGLIVIAVVGLSLNKLLRKLEFGLSKFKQSA